MVQLPVFKPDAPERFTPALCPTDFIQRALRITSSQKVLAAHLELHKARMSRVVRGGRLGFERCLLLAAFLGEDPTALMRVYRHERLYRVLQTLYVKRGYVTPERARIHEALDRLPSDEVRLMAELIDRVLSAHGIVVRDGSDEKNGGAR